MAGDETGDGEAAFHGGAGDGEEAGDAGPGDRERQDQAGVGVAPGLPEFSGRVCGDFAARGVNGRISERVAHAPRYVGKKAALLGA